jgi:hypothetical protein
MARGESAGSRFSENFLGGLQTGYDIGERYQKRKREKAVQVAQEEVYSQPLMTREQILAGRDKLRQAYAANGSPEDIARVDEQFNGMIGQKLSEGLKSARALIAAGDYDAGGAALSSAYSYLPTGSQLQVAAQPPDANGNVQFMLRGIDEQTGEPTGEGRMLDDKKLNLLLAGFEATAPELAKIYIDNASQETAQAAQQSQASLGQQNVDLRGEEIKQQGEIAKGQLGLGYAGIKARATEGALDRESVERRGQLDRDVQVKLADMRNTLDMYQTDTSAAVARSGQAIQQGQLEQSQLEFAAGRPQREASVLATQAQAEKDRNAQLGVWTQDDLRAQEGAVGQVIKNMIDNAGVTEADAPVDVPTLQANTVEILGANKPGTFSSAEALGLVLDMDRSNPNGRPQDFQYQTGAPGGNVVVTDRKTGQRFLLPETAVAKITGQPVQAAQPPAPPATPPPRQAIPTGPRGTTGNW